MQHDTAKDGVDAPKTESDHMSECKRARDHMLFCEKALTACTAANFSDARAVIGMEKAVHDAMAAIDSGMACHVKYDKFKRNTQITKDTDDIPEFEKIGNGMIRLIHNLFDHIVDHVHDLIVAENANNVKAEVWILFETLLQLRKTPPKAYDQVDIRRNSLYRKVGAQWYEHSARHGAASKQEKTHDANWSYDTMKSMVTKLMAEIEHELSELQFHVKHRNASGAMLIQWEKARNHAEQVKERLAYVNPSDFEPLLGDYFALSLFYMCRATESTLSGGSTTRYGWTPWQILCKGTDMARGMMFTLAQPKPNINAAPVPRKPVWQLHKQLYKPSKAKGDFQKWNPPTMNRKVPLSADQLRTSSIPYIDARTKNRPTTKTNHERQMPSSPNQLKDPRFLQREMPRIKEIAQIVRFDESADGKSHPSTARAVSKGLRSRLTDTLLSFGGGKQ